jgi:hypothetical protein
MRVQFIILFLLFTINCVSQDFAGEIIYKTRIIPKGSSINADSILDNTSGDSAVFSLSGANYKCTFFRKGVQVYRYIYHHATFRFYTEFPDADYITFSDSRKPHNIPKDFRIYRDSTGRILGYPCYQTEVVYDDHTSKQYYSDRIKVNPETFKGHNASDWYNKLKKVGGSINIMSVDHYKDYIMITEAVRISFRPVAKNMFKLPENKLLLMRLTRRFL